MSHFSVLVITKGKPSQEDLQKVLQPWHEYECTGVDDEYVRDVDVTDEVKEQYDEPQKVVVLGTGRVVGRWSDELYTGKEELGRKTFVLPAGAEEKELSANEARKHGVGYLTMDQAAEEWCGGKRGPDGRYYRKTNPDKKLDWWSVGGRWTGMLTPDYDPEKDPANSETCWLCYGTGKRPDMACEGGCNGCAGTGTMKKWSTQWKKHEGDQLSAAQLRGSLPALRALAVREALEKRRSMLALANGNTIPEWPEKDHDAFWEHPAVKAIREEHFWASGPEIAALREPEEVCAARAVAGAAVPFALVYRGRWHERGSGESDLDTWRDMVGKLLSDLADDEWVTVVDCHI